RPDSRRSTERPVLIAQIAPRFCKSRISSRHDRSKTGSLTRETIVPSKSVLSSRISMCQVVTCRSSDKSKRGNEDGLRTGDGAASKRPADPLAYRRSEETACRGRRNLQGENRRAGGVFEGSNLQGAKWWKVRRSRAAGEAARRRGSTVERGLRN